MASLKSQIPILAGWLRMTPDALYERQRALVRAGLLKAKPGRGRGTGVAFTPQSLATLLISVAASESLTATAEMTKIFFNLKSKGERCPLTGKKTFGTALTQILASELMQRLRWIDVNVRWDEYQAYIVVQKEEGQYYTEAELQEFYAEREKTPLLQPMDKKWDHDKVGSTASSQFTLPRTGTDRSMITRSTSLSLFWLHRALRGKQ